MEKIKVKIWRTLYFFLAVGVCLYIVIPHAAANRVDLSDGTEVKKILYAQLQEWHNVRHRTGGLSKKGIDCSGFVHLTFLSRFGIEVPRSTELLSKTGKKISQRKLRPGDLVFFKTGFKTRHVGIYVDDRKFIHVSKKKGVMMSSLDNIYWSKKYWKARRLKT